MASPAVAGMLAAAISKYGGAAPESLRDSLKRNAVPAVKGQPEGTNTT
jgi:hypothetical protein